MEHGFPVHSSAGCTLVFKRFHCPCDLLVLFLQLCCGETSEMFGTVHAVVLSLRAAHPTCHCVRQQRLTVQIGLTNVYPDSFEFVV